MKVKWYGHAAFRILPDDGPTLITDPYTPDGVGYSPIEDSADIVIISSDDDSAHCRADLIAGNPKVINALSVARNCGFTSVDGFDVQAIEAAEWQNHPEHEIPGQNGMYRWESDGVRCAHMGDVGNPLNDRQRAFYEGVDVLFALAGGYLTITLPDLMQLVHQVKPRLIVPMHFRTLTYKPRNTLWIDSFLSHFNDSEVDFACHHEVDIHASKLPNTTRVLVMDYAR